MEEISFKLLVQWALLIAVLLYLAYGALAIKNEKSVYQERAIPLKVGNFLFKIPHWWSQTENASKTEYTFVRTDTHYDWQAQITWDRSPKNFDQSLEELFTAKLSELKLSFDLETSILKSSADAGQHLLLGNCEIEVIHLEGTATEDHSSRVYFDAYLIKDFKNRSLLFAKSRSSILNGLVEGPYFEEVMTSFDYA